jgi:CRISPR/Cas system CSM-associated protein Csm3 (group 7 of RAMP superfamily)
MSSFKLEATWLFKTALHVGTGLSRAGYVDRIVRSDRAGNPALPADAVKGAIRMSAERLWRWQDGNAPPDPDPSSSLPRNPVLRRIFAAEQGAVNARYRFRPARLASASPRRYAVASTAIDTRSGVALQETLRLAEQWPAHLEFDIVLEGTGGSWHEENSQDHLDLVVLALATQLTASVGARRTAGLGQITCTTVKCEVARGSTGLMPFFDRAIDHLCGGTPCPTTN